MYIHIDSHGELYSYAYMYIVMYILYYSRCEYLIILSTIVRIYENSRGMWYIMHTYEAVDQ